MGWKNVKEHYQIDHIVHIREGKLLIGSPYISDIMIINYEGAFEKRYSSKSNDKLAIIQKEISDDIETFVRLVNSPDKFEEVMDVYTYDDDSIIKKQCEKPGWPNLTTDGELMYENTFWKTEEEAKTFALKSAEIRLKNTREYLNDSKSEVIKLTNRLKNDQNNVDKLKPNQDSGAITVEVFTSKVWIEGDMMGNHHVMVKHAIKNAEPFNFCSFFYNYAYNDNNSIRAMAEKMAISLGAEEPVKYQIREIEDTSNIDSPIKLELK